jgi:O-antigen ligase
MHSADWSLIGLGLVSVGLAIRGLFRPFLGLLVLMTLHFIQPSEWVPALAPFRIELTYGILMLLLLLRTKAGSILTILKTNPIVRATMGLEVVVLVTIPLSIWPGGAFAEATELSKMIMLQILMTFFIDTEARLRSILWLLVGFLLWFAGSSFSAYLHGQYYIVNGVQRIQGVNSMVGDPNALAGLLLALLPFLVALIRCSKNFLIKLLLMACGGMVLSALLLTGARISLLALVPVVIFYILQSKRKILGLTAAVVLALVVWFSLPAQYQKRYLTVKTYAEGGQLDDSNKLRLAIWDAGWRMFLDHPFLGVGAGQFSTAYGMVYSRQIHHAWMQPHSLFLQVTCELGLVGLLAFGNLIVQIWRANRKLMKFKTFPQYNTIYQFALACSLMMIGIAVVSSVSHTLYRPYWYLLAGMVAANRRIADAMQNPAPGSIELAEDDFKSCALYGLQRATAKDESI